MNKCLAAIAALLLICCGAERETASPSAKGGFTLYSPGADSLIVRYPDGTQSVLEARGQSHDYLISPDSQKIAVSTRLLSNLSVLQVFSREPDGAFDTDAPLNVSGVAWDSVAKINGIAPDDILFPKSFAVRWTRNGDGLLVKLNGSTEEGLQLSDTMDIDVPR